MWQGGRLGTSRYLLNFKSCNQGVSQISAQRQHLSQSGFLLHSRPVKWVFKLEVQSKLFSINFRFNATPSCWMSNLFDANLSIFWVTRRGDIPACYCETISTWILDGVMSGTLAMTRPVCPFLLSTFSLGLHYSNWTLQFLITFWGKAPPHKACRDAHTPEFFCCNEILLFLTGLKS